MTKNNELFNEIRTKKTSAFSFWMSLAVTLLLSVLLALFMEPILLFFGTNTYTLLYTKDYLFWVFVIGGVPTVAGLILGHLVRDVGKTKEAGIDLTIGGIMNIFWGVTGLMWVQTITDSLSCLLIYCR